jgi:hypothetical protein
MERREKGNGEIAGELFFKPGMTLFDQKLVVDLEVQGADAALRATR